MMPQYDAYVQELELPARKSGTAGQAPLLYVAGCANGVYPCTGTNRQAMDPQTGQFLGPNSAARNRHARAEHRQYRPTASSPRVRGSPRRTTLSDGLAVAPRVGAAWDVKGNQQFVVRGGVGLFFDRPPANTVYNTVNNPPFTRNVTVRYGQLQNIEQRGPDAPRRRRR